MAEAGIDRPWSRDMGFSREEFIRVLPRALADYRIEPAGEDRWHIGDRVGDLQLWLCIEPRPPRRIGALSLPVLAVEIGFLAGADERRRAFLRRFERGFHKGGG